MDIKDKFKGEGITYDDVLLIPSYSEIMPRDVNLKTKLTNTSDGRGTPR